MSELLKTLRVVKMLSEADATAQALQDSLGVSVATLNRHISDARNMGAQIVAVQTRRAWQYCLKNPDLVMPTVTRWIELEEKRSLV